MLGHSYESDVEWRLRIAMACVLLTMEITRARLDRRQIRIDKLPKGIAFVRVNTVFPKAPPWL